jgi:pimeloyl-ACP methyl ester carboxylesterase
MKKYLLLLLLLVRTILLFSQGELARYEKTKSFLPDAGDITRKNVEYGYLTVPENWDKPEGNQIKIAVCVIKKNTSSDSSGAVLFIEGGPGSGAISGIWDWLNHPLRKKNDIILVDIRGTGFSQPVFCPDLGKKFLEILARNQKSSDNEMQKIAAALDCKRDLENRGVDLAAYNSRSVAKDLNALKKALKLHQWNVYGVSYGTYIAQVYNAEFPGDTKALILDSPIPATADYYNKNTSAYFGSLKKVFTLFAKDGEAGKFPGLEKTYYETIENLNRNPITVKVDRGIVASGEFTFNAEDFKIAIQQSLYNRKMIQIVPLLIYQFNKRNKKVLSTLVRSFSGALGLDYGVYYCMTCNEGMPSSSIAAFDKDAAQYPLLKGGLSFYRSDFSVCSKWNTGRLITTVTDSAAAAPPALPVLIFSGAFDPITPPDNGIFTSRKYGGSFLVRAPVSAHGCSFSQTASNIINDFVNNPGSRPADSELAADSTMKFITDVRLSGGIAGMAANLNMPDPLFFAPLALAFVIITCWLFAYVYTSVRQRKKITAGRPLRLLMLAATVLIISAAVGFVMKINSTAEENFYVLAFGLPGKYSYLFVMLWVYAGVVACALGYFVVKMSVIKNAAIVFSVLFSLLLILAYFQYWGFLF